MLGLVIVAVATLTVRQQLQAELLM